ncbi:uncharacterized protein TRIADDRAFT_31955 [Trichoplax adhaerens]|uniref:Peptidase M20 dimerisation domain-containing protein n=1 Tax=Trichoplax adhaerens TaxID=10228 RepID=B3SA75_TRIAD|nr:hypothetical protein TRIADDRAFT_31955 [Trichoplax adhaerens]EDV20466.1 hypothetical protein TRIADDRAFT_31955 [Trichoplax adhaerens]|eukprot:XP_002117160.1 hypothetical protein TRIADDRAFT_31955 [Trichoplax adhaerens]
MKTRKILSLILKSLLLILGVIIVAVIIRTVTFPDAQPYFEKCKVSDSDFIPLNDVRLQHFRTAIQIPTVCTSIDNCNFTAILQLHDHIQESFPLIHSSNFIQRILFANYTLLYRVEGTNSTLPPYMLVSHLDVVPAKAAEWQVDPFSATVKEGYIFGRGTLDVKQTLFGMMEALEFRLAKGQRPIRTFYMAMGHDEEVSGLRGAKAVANYFSSRGITLDFISDEGMVVADGILPGMQTPVALIGIAEKGMATFEFSVSVTPGHASMPAGETSIGILSKAMVSLEQNPHENFFGKGPERLLLEYVVNKMTLPHRVLMANLWLFGPLIARAFALKPNTNAIIRTTTALTMFNAGVKWNVISSTAKAVVNHRIHPLQSVADVLKIDKKIIQDDRVKVKILSAYEPSPISPTDSDGYRILHQSIYQIFEVPVAPALFIASSDSKHFVKLSKNIYRFAPSFLNSAELKGIHGNNEKIKIKNYEQTINFYYHLMINAEKSANLKSAFDKGHQDL